MELNRNKGDRVTKRLFSILTVIVFLLQVIPGGLVHSTSVYARGFIPISIVDSSQVRGKQGILDSVTKSSEKQRQNDSPYGPDNRRAVSFSEPAQAQGEVNIDIGYEGLEYNNIASYGYTRINLENPANDDGILTKAVIGVHIAITDMFIGTFYEEGSDFICRDEYYIGDVGVGENEIDVVLQVKTGDFIGCWFRTGQILRQIGGAGGFSYIKANSVRTGDGFTPTGTQATHRICLYATGTTDMSSLPAGSIKATANSTARSKYGLKYPLTYEFFLPSGSDNLSAYTKHEPEDLWERLTEKDTGEYFNGIECVRFDYTHDRAYISAEFDDSNDDIYIKIVDSGDNSIDSFYKGVCRFYDNRRMVFTASNDDYKDVFSSSHHSAIDAFQARNIWYTVSVITGYTGSANWDLLQAQYDEGYVEVASHSRTHPVVPYDDVQSEVEGSRDDITGNLTFDGIYELNGTEYVLAWIEPEGEMDDDIREALGDYKYLCDRRYMVGVRTIADWDPINEVYGRTGGSQEIGSVSVLETLNSNFDEGYAERAVFHLITHPQALNWSEGQIPQQHLDYVANRTDVWYTGFGALYAYHYPATEEGVLIIGRYTGEDLSAPEVTTGSALSITCGTAYGAGNVTATSGGNVTERGFQYGTGDFSSNVSETGNWGIAGFTLQMTELEPASEYQYRAYAINDVGIGYGNPANFTTSASADPAVTTDAATSVADVKAKLNVTLSGLTCSEVSDILWEWGTETGNYTDNYTDSTNRGNGAVYYRLTGLTANTTYYYRAAARIAGGSYQYGSEESFTTDEVKFGDANEDGNINVLDITKTVRIILGLDAETPEADADKNSTVDVLDITRIAGLILGLE